MLKKAHLLHMKVTLNTKAMFSWSDDVGGEETAARLIMDRLRCSRSKAEKLASGRYPSSVSFLEQQALAELMAKPHGVVWKIRQKAS